MENFLKQLWTDYLEKTEWLEKRGQPSKESYAARTRLVFAMLLELKAFIYQYEFVDNKEKIRYHKHHVPKFMAELVFLIHVQRLENTTQLVSDRVRKKLLEKEKRDLNRFFEKNLSLSQYMSGNNDYLDGQYFLQEGVQMEFPFLDESAFVLESRFITVTGFTIARILAYGRLLPHLEELLAKDPDAVKEGRTEVSSLNWTDTGMSLTEMAYALKYSGAVNKGNVDVKEIADALATAFHAPDVNIYRNKQDLYSRKSQSMFLDRLRKALILGLEESDGG